MIIFLCLVFCALITGRIGHDKNRPYMLWFFTGLFFGIFGIIFAICVSEIKVFSTGWHPDPTGRHGSRYHDGKYWTHRAMSNEVEVSDYMS
jgi:hypothetical protein